MGGIETKKYMRKKNARRETKILIFIIFWATSYLRKNINNFGEVRKNMNSCGKNTKNMTNA